jgi:hypothetical protein
MLSNLLIISLHSVIVAETAIYLSSRIFYDNVRVNAKDDGEKKSFLHPHKNSTRKESEKKKWDVNIII